MSRSRHHGCGSDYSALELLKARAGKAPTLDEYEVGVPTCPSCLSAMERADDWCECGEFDPDDRRDDPLLGRLRFAHDADGRYILLGTPNEVKPDRALRAALVASRTIPNGTDSVELLDECRNPRDYSA